MMKGEELTVAWGAVGVRELSGKDASGEGVWRGFLQTLQVLVV
jgi:hypothetical protein